MGRIHLPNGIPWSPYEKYKVFSQYLYKMICDVQLSQKARQEQCAWTGIVGKLGIVVHACGLSTPAGRESKRSYIGQLGLLRKWCVVVVWSSLTASPGC